MAENYYGRSLSVTVQNGQLVIAIGVNVLAHAVSYSEWANPYDEKELDYIRTFAITDAETFAADVKRAMLDEREDGSSLLTDFLDKATGAAVDDGSEACDYEARILHGQTAPSEIWAPPRAEEPPAPKVVKGDRCSAPWAPLQLHTWDGNVCRYCGGLREEPPTPRQET